MGDTKRGGFSKIKGGTYERKVAKQLSVWMFDDPNILKRHPTSGADKCIWSGDVVPLAQLPKEWNGHFNFFIECKSGYEKHIPDFYSYKKIEQWLIKAYEESQDHNQNIIFLVTQFKHKIPLLFTNKFIGDCIREPLPRAAIPISYNNSVIWVYVYDFNNLINTFKFHDLYNISGDEK